MASGGQPAAAWEACSRPGCIGARAHGADLCLAHASGHPWGDTLDARGCVIDAPLLASISGALGAARAASFERATFVGDVDLAGTVFTFPVSFDGATFGGSLDLSGARFEGHARFGSVTVKGAAAFDGAAFGGQAWLSGSRFMAGASFAAASFAAPAWFGAAGFDADVSFAGAVFAASASFREATFGCHADFAGTVFDGAAQFDGATFARPARYDGAEFRGAGEAPRGAGRQMAWTGATLAPWHTRAVASIVDLGLPVAAMAAGWLAAGRAGLLAGVTIALALIARGLVVQGRTGQSPGKRRAGISMVEAGAGLPAGPRRSITRFALHAVDSVPVPIGWLRPLWDPRRQTFADKIAGTVVVVDRGWGLAGGVGTWATAPAGAAAGAEPASFG